MKKNCTARTVYLLLFLPVVMMACSDRKQAADNGAMHEWETDSSILMAARPVGQFIQSSIDAITPESGTRIFSIVLPGVVTYDDRNKTSISSRVSGRIERLVIKYNYQPVKKGQLIMELYAPDLAAAQREAIYLSHTADNEMLLRAKQRLELLGMHRAQIEQVIRSGNILYRIPVYSPADGFILESSKAATPAPASTTGGGMDEMNTQPLSQTGTAETVKNSPLLLREGQYVTSGQSLFTIYDMKGLVAEFSVDPRLSAVLKKEQKILLHTVADKSKMIAADIGLVEPIVREGKSFGIVRIYLNDSGLQPGQLLTGNVAVLINKGYWLPQRAVWRTGKRSVVFVKENGAYRPEEVVTGIETNGMVQVLSDVAGWSVASNAQYLVDSESFIDINPQNTNP